MSDADMNVIVHEALLTEIVRLKVENGQWRGMGQRWEKDQAKLARVEALIATWRKSPDLRTRAHADRLSEAFDGRPRE